MRLLLVIAAVSLGSAIPTALAAGGKVFFEDTVPSGKASSVTITTHHASSFKVLLRVPTAGRAKLYLLGKKAPKPGLLIDTKTFACDGAAGSFFCKASYEPLPKGTSMTYTGWYDNSAANPANPDPSAAVKWGPQTNEEMHLGYLEFVFDMPPVVIPKGGVEIPAAYKTMFRNIVFVVYDVGLIRDTDRFCGHFETHDGVVVRVVKH